MNAYLEQQQCQDTFNRWNSWGYLCIAIAVLSWKTNSRKSPEKSGSKMKMLRRISFSNCRLKRRQAMSRSANSEAILSFLWLIKLEEEKVRWIKKLEKNFLFSSRISSNRLIAEDFTRWLRWKDEKNFLIAISPFDPLPWFTFRRFSIKFDCIWIWICLKIKNIKYCGCLLKSIPDSVSLHSLSLPSDFLCFPTSSKLPNIETLFDSCLGPVLIRRYFLSELEIY